VRNAAIKPNIHDVIFFGKFLAAAFAGNGRVNEVLDILCPPCICTFCTEQICNVLDGGVVDDWLLAILTINNRDWHAPSSLTGNTPVAAIPYHALDAFFAPFRNPLNGFDCTDGIILEALNGTEPLFGCTINNRLVATPAVRILMDNPFSCQHCSTFYQLCSNCLVCLLGVHAFKFASFCGLLAVCIHANQNADFIIILADFKVFYTIAWSGMNTTCTAFQCNMVTDNDHGIPVIQRVLGLDVFQFAAHECADGFIIGDTSRFHGRCNQFYCHAVIFQTSLYEGVFIIRANANSEIARNGPGSRCPDNEVNLLRVNAQLREHTLVIHYLELYIDRITWIVFIFNFCFCQGSLAIRTPVYRLQALVHIATLCHFAKDFHLSCFIFRLQS